MTKAAEIKNLAARILDRRKVEPEGRKATVAIPAKAEVNTPARSQNRVKKWHPVRPTTSMVRNWKTARKWILSHLEELQAHGWTRATLFMAGRLSYPHGPWGIAWHSAWTRPNVRVDIGTRGEIIFSWTETNGHTIQQTARP